jgi:hypothetical protein
MVGICLWNGSGCHQVKNLKALEAEAFMKKAADDLGHARPTTSAFR